MQDTLLYVFVVVDDFCSKFENLWRSHRISTSKHSGRPPKLALSEIMTILIAFHLSDFRHFKGFYLYLLAHASAEFPRLPSYPRFVSSMKSATIPLVAFFEFVRGVETDSYFIDSTALAVCKNKRIYTHKVFEGIAKRGKNTMGWFFGFKLHLVCNQQGAPVSFRLTPGNVDDRKAGEKVLKDLRGTVIGDKGYISKDLFQRLFGRGLRLVTSLRIKMKPQLVTLDDSEAMDNRSLIESVFNVLKNAMHLEHSRHRSLANFMVNILGTMSAFALRGMNSRVFKEKCTQFLES